MNLRLSQDLKQDLDVVTSLLKVNRSEWVKTKLAEEMEFIKKTTIKSIKMLRSKLKKR